jgi:hypothetical protein
MEPCALLAADEPLAGTAPRARGWVLVEHPGAWARDALAGASPAVNRALAPLVGTPDLRVQLIRRPGGQRPGRPGTRHLVLAHTGAVPWLESLEVTDTELADFDLRQVLAVRPPGIGTSDERPRVLVCTHGSRDRCCAERGRPIAAALAAVLGETVWETSHVGGHRFAGNVVVLPAGLVLGHLDASGAVDALALLAAGRLPLTSMRGRSGLDAAGQAAEILARRQLGNDVDVPVTARPVEAGVHLTLGSDAYLVRLHREPLGHARLLSCSDQTEEDPGRWVLDAVEPADRAQLTR